MSPYFSVVIPLYNKEKYISDTLESVLHQSFTDFEIIIVNDGSTDSSVSMVSKFKDHRISVFSIENSGVSKARNFGVSKANSKLIAFLDADDTWLPHHLIDLKKLYEEYPNCGLYAKAYATVNGNQHITSHFKGIPNNKTWRGVLDNYFDSSMYNSIAHTSSVMIPKVIFETIGGFNNHYNSGEDLDLWIRIALHYPVAFYNKVSSIYTTSHTGSITNLALSKRQFFNLEAYQDYEINNPSLKKYMDLNRLSLAFQYKLANDTKTANNYIKDIKKENISWFQRTLLKSPNFLLKTLLKLRGNLRKLHLDLRLFR